MRVLILSDVHSNIHALRAVEADAGHVDHILFIGDAVNYGPDPGACIDWLTSHQITGVRGNHDHAVAFGCDPKASSAKEPLALAMRDWTRDQLDAVQTGWLLQLPRRLDCYLGGAKFSLVHGTPVDPLYDYRLQPDATDELLAELLGGIRADYLITGHTHLPVNRFYGSTHIINPGSVGQPLDGDPRAAYAIWNDGTVELRRVAYDRSRVLESLNNLPLEKHQIDDLRYTIDHGRMASSRAIAPSLASEESAPTLLIPPEVDFVRTLWPYE